MLLELGMKVSLMIFENFRTYSHQVSTQRQLKIGTYQLRRSSHEGFHCFAKSVPRAKHHLGHPCKTRSQVDTVVRFDQSMSSPMKYNPLPLQEGHRPASTNHKPYPRCDLCSGWKQTDEGRQTLGQPSTWRCFPKRHRFHSGSFSIYSWQPSHINCRRRMCSWILLFEEEKSDYECPLRKYTVYFSGFEETQSQPAFLGVSQEISHKMTLKLPNSSKMPRG